MDLFDATLATITCALVGLWWVVVRFKFETLLATAQGRAAAYAASLALLILTALYSFVTNQLFGQKPIISEALINVSIVVLGVQFAWQIFTEDKPKTA